AALVDETPTGAELAHLTSCPECARERAAYQAVADLASAEANRLGAPLTTWDALAPVLVADGVIDDGRGLRFTARSTRRPWLQAAAAVLLLSGGVVAGRWSARMTTPTPTSNVALTLPGDSVQTFRTVQEARNAQAQAQSAYQTATAYLAQQDTSGLAIESPSAMRARLAALDRTRDAMGEALNEAPYDPVINSYYLTTIGQREATMRRLNTVLPASMQMVRD